MTDDKHSLPATRHSPPATHGSPLGAPPLLEVRGLRKFFPIAKGQTLGLVGESGSGKTTLGRCILRAITPTAGQVLLQVNGQSVDVTTLPAKELRLVRRHMQMVFQDPYSSLDPRKTILDIVGEPLRMNKVAKGRALEARVKELVEIVGLNVRYLYRYPHAFSGGQRQRIGLARALALNPELIVCDEPVSALDVSVQAQILNLFQDLQQEFNLTYLFIAHDLGVVQHIADRVAVMYVGQLVEMADTADLFYRPQHPYTEALLSAVPKPDPDRPLQEIPLAGEIASPSAPPSGCYFHPRCRYSDGERCQQEAPALREITPGHFARCHYAERLTLEGIR